MHANTCGQEYFELNKHGFADNHINIQSINFQNYDSINLKLYTSYVGKVFQTCLITPDKQNVFMECFKQINDRTINVKVIDVQQYHLNPQAKYSLQQLQNLQSMKINIQDNIHNYYLLLLIQRKIYVLHNDLNKIKEIENLIKLFEQNNKIHREPFNSYIKKTLNMSVSYFDRTRNYNRTLTEYKKYFKKIALNNMPVDILFNTCSYLDFLYEKTGKISINDNDVLVSIMNIPELDNAFWNGSYMIYGNGDKIMYPLGCPDVVAHELTHGLIQNMSNFEYKGHSGALNESFADVFGCCYEFYIYDKNKKNKEFKGESDWLMGEDIMQNKKSMRDMIHPNNCNQPCKYKGKYWMDPKSPVDHGGVHVNSGLSNHLFYLLSQKYNMNKAFSIYFKCLTLLNKTSNYLQFRDVLKKCSPTDCSDILLQVGLTDHIINDELRYYPTRRYPPRRYPRRRHTPY